MWLTRPHPVPAPARIPALVLSALLTVAFGRSVPAAAEPAESPIELLALNGFDPVSYFLKGGPVAGTARFELSWGGRVWRFASGADRAAFRDNPEVYAPRLGGYDGLGVLDGRLVDADPLVFAVIGERLYLFRDAGRRARFLGEPGLAGQAEAAWPGLHDQLDIPPRDSPR
ncbi:YHS domain-containing (seleno)protein [Methylobacterium sp. NEAU K]|uniref:YHS domain-containing (seleno)protein n=1 Tax=Methylobacterium sp. NEAU K TaxID=3064946 RepID=UPI002735B341|nr:YHS domain-containing (seleno)protein [Methylobacterium sp. NEAU K]MDP4005262.1 YHS domain-containing (seleno)protein [Methylobacterium sp. NEAU K]